MEEFIKKIESIANISNGDWLIFFSFLKTREYPKKHTFLKIGEIANYVSFIEKGEVRLLIPKGDEEKEITFGFSFKDEFISAYDSFLTRSPSIN